MRPDEGKDIIYSTIHVERNEESEIIGVIECSTFERGSHVKFPECNHVFTNGNMWQSVSYNKKNYFHTWKNMKVKAIAFIESFENKTED